ncbi:SDR family oxidoreductase [Bradyrhizobium sp. dw_411]|uniref:SDR family NAD(P)-dependent oxidoreductase n=1 Tax=Bradyrhizobium sp. dw_411 TaxID=2720082 RepID=UPI001BCE8629|nr:SDR family oxidoreductase [Bradyrhizobium sp. dw_411]
MNESAETRLPRMPSIRLEGKRALVTGAGRGIGLGCAAALAEAGAHVVLAARTESEIETAAAAIRRAGGSADPCVLDVQDVAAVRRVVSDHGPFDAFVNNAGGSRHQPFLEVEEKAFDDVVALNLRAAFFAGQIVARSMVDAGKGGSIVNISSQMGHVGGPGRSVYCATKFAMEGWTKAAAIELGLHRIRINTLCPTFIDTPMTRPFFDDPAFRLWLGDKIKLGRVGRLEDIMGAVVFLCSDASALMTGSAVLLDGGWTAE